MRREGQMYGRFGIICVRMANKICLEALSEALPCSIAEVDCGCNLTAEVDCPESSRAMTSEFLFGEPIATGKKRL
jgi:hypothetical protein